MPVVNQVGNTLTGSTGTGTFVGANTPTLITPTLGAATATSINFGTTALNTYTEGTWVPADYSGAALVFTGVVANYTRIGRMVTVSCQVTFPVTASGAGAVIGGLPFATANSTGSQGGVVVFTSVAALELARTIPAGDFLVLLTSVGANVTNLQMSATTVQLQATYFV